MAFCSSCGAEVQGKFCAKCGTPMGAGASPPSSAASAAGLDENLASALCYLALVLTGVLFLVIEPYSRNRTIRFHAFQSIFTWIAIIVIGMALKICLYFVVALPFIGWMIYILIWMAYSLGVLGLWLFLMYKAYNKERFVLPVVGPLAEKQAQSL